jgi:DNA-binding transcriptional LysR family regulator
VNAEVHGVRQQTGCDQLVQQRNGEFISGETVKRCVEAGTMIGVLAHISVASELDTGRLIALPWNGPPLTLSSYLVAYQPRSISPAHAAFRAATREFYVKSEGQPSPPSRVSRLDGSAAGLV